MTARDSSLNQVPAQSIYVLITAADGLRPGWIDPQAGPLECMLTLARGLAASPHWVTIPKAALIVRSGPQPLLGVVGTFDLAAQARLAFLRWQLTHIWPGLRYVSYRQAELDCERLSAQLVAQFGHEALSTYHFVGLPRGGLIVLGMLAYCLGLQHHQLHLLPPPDTPLVVVDDCALSGVRFGRFLQSYPIHRMIFAPLYSPPDLRRAILSQESQVVACLSAWDLHDHAPERLGRGYEAWYARWMARSDSPCYWVGQPAPVAFAWNEPDQSIWNPFTEQAEDAWPLLPPEYCLKYRSQRDTAAIVIQQQPFGKGPLRPADAGLFGELEDQIIVGHIHTGLSFSLADVAADMWRALIEHGTVDGMVNALLLKSDG